MTRTMAWVNSSAGDYHQIRKGQVEAIIID